MLAPPCYILKSFGSASTFEPSLNLHNRAGLDGMASPKFYMLPAFFVFWKEFFV